MYLMSFDDTVTFTHTGLINIRVIPNASKNKIQNEKDSDGNQIIKVYVTAQREKGEANEAVITLLSKEWKIAKSKFKIIHGHTSQNKTIMILE